MPVAMTVISFRECLYAIFSSADAYREIKTSLFEEHGFVLKRECQVAQNGAFNKIRGKYNPLELWQVPYKSESPSKRRKKR